MLHTVERGGVDGAEETNPGWRIGPLSDKRKHSHRHNDKKPHELGSSKTRKDGRRIWKSRVRPAVNRLISHCDTLECARGTGTPTIALVVDERDVTCANTASFTSINSRSFQCALPSMFTLPYKQDAQLSHCRVRSFGQKWKTGTGRQYFTDIILQPLWHNRPIKLSNSVKNAK